VIVNQSMANIPGPVSVPSASGCTSAIRKKGLPWATVVGVVADTKLGSPDEPSNDQWYMPAQQPATLYGSDASEASSRAPPSDTSPFVLRFLPSR
jgi:hypothetical protein